MTEYEAMQIVRAVESIERGEEWRGGEPTLGTCKALATIKQLARAAETREQAGCGPICPSCFREKECTVARPTVTVCALWEAKNGEVP